jgi:hypothetical protein
MHQFNTVLKSIKQSLLVENWFLLNDGLGREYVIYRVFRASEGYNPFLTRQNGS